MDRMKEGDAREVIRWEAEQHVPFDMANVELDFQILDPDAEGLQMNVLLVAAKRELVESRVGLLTEAGLDPSVIDVDAFAIHNAFELNHPDAMQGVVGLVNIGHEVTNRKSTRLNSSHANISYAVFCLKIKITSTSTTLTRYDR